MSFKFAVIPTTLLCSECGTMCGGEYNKETGTVLIKHGGFWGGWNCSRDNKEFIYRPEQVELEEMK